MSNYTKATDFAAKDALVSGDPNKIVSGTEINTEFTNVQTSNNTKANKKVPATTSNMATLDGAGDLADSGFLFSGTGGEVSATAANLNKTNTTASTADLSSCTNFEETVSATTSEVTIAATKTFDIATKENLKLGSVLISPVVQIVEANTVAVVGPITTSIPDDDTIPTSTEGEEVLTASITPKYSDSTLVIEFSSNCTDNYTGYVHTTLFQDAGTAAIAASRTSIPVVNFSSTVHLQYKMTSGTISSTTFRIRMGSSAGVSALTVNGNAGVRKLGGALVTSLKITEVL